MLELYVITKDSHYRFEKVRNKRPRTYMYGWSFKQMLNYTKEQLYWQDIDVDDVVGFQLCNPNSQTVQHIMRDNK